MYGESSNGEKNSRRAPGGICETVLKLWNDNRSDTSYALVVFLHAVHVVDDIGPRLIKKVPQVQDGQPSDYSDDGDQPSSSGSPPTEGSTSHLGRGTRQTLSQVMRSIIRSLSYVSGPA